ncbi:MAG: hypothetical protein ACO1RX_22835 [Candidatus Sericytochromatia bacterium]
MTEFQPPALPPIQRSNSWAERMQRQQPLSSQLKQIALERALQNREIVETGPFPDLVLLKIYAHPLENPPSAPETL